MRFCSVLRAVECILYTRNLVFYIRVRAQIVYVCNNSLWKPPPVTYSPRKRKTFELAGGVRILAMKSQATERKLARGHADGPD